jgi:hypothetical protein
MHHSTTHVAASQYIQQQQQLQRHENSVKHSDSVTMTVLLLVSFVNRCSAHHQVVKCALCQELEPTATDWYRAAQLCYYLLNGSSKHVSLLMGS